jgi:hypothetical protein
MFCKRKEGWFFHVPTRRGKPHSIIANRWPDASGVVQLNNVHSFGIGDGVFYVGMLVKIVTLGEPVPWDDPITYELSYILVSLEGRAIFMLTSRARDCGPPTTWVSRGFRMFLIITVT